MKFCIQGAGSKGICASSTRWASDSSSSAVRSTAATCSGSTAASFGASVAYPTRSMPGSRSAVAANPSGGEGERVARLIAREDVEGQGRLRDRPRDDALGDEPDRVVGDGGDRHAPAGRL